MSQDVPESDPRDVALNLLARREHSRAELRAKLLKRGFESQCLEQCLSELADEGLLSEQRFAESFIRSRAARGQGPVRIRQELRQRGVDDTTISIALDECGEDWFDIAREVKRRKFGEEEPADMKARAKQHRFLEYRGFSAKQIRIAMASE